MQKKYILFGGLALLLLLIIGGTVFAFTKLRSSETQEETGPQKKRIALPVNVIPVEERPVIALAPSSSGRNVEISVDAVKKSADEVDIELEYQAGTLLQGYQGLLSLSSLPATQDVLLGSCSAGGACTYHEDVTGGTLVGTFRGGEEYAVKSDWRFIENTDKEDTFSSKDAKFTLQADKFKQVAYAIIFNSPGYPEGLTGTVVADHYSVRFTGTAPDEATVSIRAAEEGELTIHGWDGSKWLPMETTVDGKVATATGPIMKLYTVSK